jgi:hypothetical protein
MDGTSHARPSFISTTTHWHRIEGEPNDQSEKDSVGGIDGDDRGWSTHRTGRRWPGRNPPSVAGLQNRVPMDLLQLPDSERDDLPHQGVLDRLRLTS